MVKKSVKPPRSSQRKKWLNTLQASDASANHGGKNPTLNSVLIDANVWYSAFTAGGNAEIVLASCVEANVIVMSAPLAEELIELLRHQANAPYRWLRLLRLQLEAQCRWVEIDESVEVVRDPKDNHIIAAALAGECQYVITGDKDLLVLVDNFHFDILTPAEFIF